LLQVVILLQRKAVDIQSFAQRICSTTKNILFFYFDKKELLRRVLNLNLHLNLKDCYNIQLAKKPETNQNRRNHL